MPRIYARGTSDHTVDNFILCHLHREEEDATLINACNIIGKVLCKSGFTHSRSGADNDKVTSLKACCLVIEVAKTGFKPTERTFISMKSFHTVKGIDKKILKGGIFGFCCLVRDGKEFFFGGAKHSRDISSAVIGLVSDLGPSTN